MANFDVREGHPHRHRDTVSACWMSFASTQVRSDESRPSDDAVELGFETAASGRAHSAGRGTFVATIALFVSTYLVFCISPIVNTSDSMYSMVLSESILDSHTTHLNEYQFPEPIAQLRTSAPPIYDPRNPHSYQLGNVNGNVVYCYPNGSSILSVPFVALMNALAISAVTPDRKYNKSGELIIQKTLAALLMALLACIVYRTGLLLLGAAPSALVALGFSFGTQVWSTGTRALWSHTWFIFLGGLVVYHLLSVEVEHRTVRPVLLASIVSWMYFVRPTGAITIACVSVYVLVYHRSRFVAFTVTTASWLAGFVVYSWITFDELIPGYYRSRFGSHDFWIGLYGNLVGPSRGLFIYVPVLGFVLYLIVRHWRTVPLRRLAVLSTTIAVANAVAIAAYPCWWGGYCYGPRLMMDTLPWFALMAIIGCAAASVGRSSVLSRGELAAALILFALSVAINGRGALSPPTQQWSILVDLDKHPERALDWSYPQFAAGLVSPPDYVLENIKRLRRDASKSGG